MNGLAGISPNRSVNTINPAVESRRSAERIDLRWVQPGGAMQRNLRLACAISLCVPALHINLSLSAESGDRPALVPWNRAKVPFQPVLTVNRDDKVCNAVLAEAKRQFFSEQQYSRLTSDAESTLQWVEWQPAGRIDESEVGRGGETQRVDLDLDGTGSKQALVYFKYWERWQCEYGTASVVRTPTDYERLLSNVAVTTILRGDAQDVESAAIKPYYPSWRVLGSDEVKDGQGDACAPHALFEVAGRYYFLDRPIEGEGQAEQTVSAMRLHSTGEVESYCAITLRPASAGLVLQKQQALRPYLSFISTIGEGGDDCGSLHSGYRHNLQANDALARAAVRPWATSRANTSWAREYFEANARLDTFLIDWSLRDVWARREYQTYLEARGLARRALAQYYETAFGLEAPRATAVAANVQASLTAARMLVPNGYQPPNDLYNLKALPLTRMILSLQPEALEAIGSAQLDECSATDTFCKPHELGHNAVEWLDALKALLDAGLNVNSSNNFGKTPLMMAAHMNRLDSVDLLIERGAEVNQVTPKVRQYCQQIVHGRTALMYAAENGGKHVIRKLLKAGADPTAVDAIGRSANQYLLLNPRFTSAERAGGVVKLVESMSDGDAKASFDCANAKKQSEKLICSDDTLRMLDAEVDEAYRSIRDEVGSLFRDDQRAWLKRRDLACAQQVQPSIRVPCMQQVLRARVRFLHRLHSPELLEIQ